MFKKYFKEYKLIYPVCIFISSFVLYILTMPRTVFWGDSGELITAAYTLGIAHPTGYPLYIFLGKIFSLLPFGTIAFRLNMMSGFFGAMSAMMLYLTAYRLTKNKITGILSAALLSATPLFWEQSTLAEVYTLHIFLMLLGFYMLLRWSEDHKIKWLYLFALVYGLSFTNHLTSLVLLPAYAYLILLRTDNSSFRFNRIKIRTWIICILIFLLALTPYLYFPIRSSMDPVLDWGNTEHMGNFIMHITGERYQGQYAIAPDFKNGIIKLGSYLFSQYHILLAFLAVGLLTLNIKKDYKIALGLIAFFIIIFNLMYSIPDIGHYYLPLFVIISFLTGFGIDWILCFTRRFKPYAVGFVIIAIIISSFSMNTYLDKHDDYSARDYAISVFDRLDRNSVLLTNKDENSVLWYFQFAEDMRKDVIVIPLVCIVYDYCVTQAFMQNYIVADSTFTPVGSLEIMPYIEDIKEKAVPRKTYYTDIFNYPDRDNPDTWKIKEVR